MAMERHARFTLDKLKELFAVTGKPDLHDGPAMIKRFLSDGSTAASTNISTEKAEENFKAMMAKPLPDGVDPSTFACATLLSTCPSTASGVSRSTRSTRARSI